MSPCILSRYQLQIVSNSLNDVIILFTSIPMNSTFANPMYKSMETDPACLQTNVDPIPSYLVLIQLLYSNMNVRASFIYL